VMRVAGDSLHGRRLRGLIAVLWRAGLRSSEALALAESNLDARRGAVLVRRGTGGRRREVGMDDWGRQELGPWLTSRLELPVGPLFCIITGPTRGRRWSTAAARNEMRHAAAVAGVAGGSRRTSFATRTPSKWHTKASRCSSSNASSATATSASHHDRGRHRGVVVPVLPGALLLWAAKLRNAGVPRRSIVVGVVLAGVGFFVIPVVGFFVGFPLGIYVEERRRLGTHAPAWLSTRKALRALGLSMLIELSATVLAAAVWLATVLS